MKSQAKYVQLLERELEAFKSLLGQARKDIEFYRAKVERLELSLREAGMIVAAPPTEAKSLADTVSELKRLPSGKMPFQELKRRWQNLTEAEQQKALVDGWNLDAPPTEEKKEDANAGQ
ncbi:MAG TPA: hypothetical protein VF772_17515 [Terriglobales bacterium]